MKTTLVLCIFAMVLALVFASGGGHDSHGDAGGHGGGNRKGYAGHGDGGYADGGHSSSASALQFCFTLFSFAVLVAFNKLY